jgi:hypothetical protein
VQNGVTTPLAMSSPWKHPKTGIYQLRKAVPEDLRKLVGTREEKVTLNTRDPVEAKQRFAKALAELEAPSMRTKSIQGAILTRKASCRVPIVDRPVDGVRSREARFWCLEALGHSGPACRTTCSGQVAGGKPRGCRRVQLRSRLCCGNDHARKRAPIKWEHEPLQHPRPSRSCAR